MAISSIGVGSNLNLSTLLTQLETAEQAPLTALSTKAASYTSKLSAYSQVASALSTLQTASDKLAKSSLYATVKSSALPTDVLNATTTESAVAGTYNINVTQLAQSQSLVSAGVAKSNTVIGSGTIKIDFGTIVGGTLDPATGQYTGSSFNANTDIKSMEVKIESGSGTLEQIRDAINKANGGATASIVNDGTGSPYRLVLTSKATGETSSLKISVTGDAALENLLSNDPAGTQNLRQTVVAQNAKLNVNGIDIQSASNSVQEAVPGTTLALQKTGTVALTMTQDTSVVETAVNDFVKAYNALQSLSKTLTAYDTDTNTGAALVGDSTLRSIMNRVRGVLNQPQSADANQIKVLSEAGVTLDPKDGTMKVDSEKLKKTIANNMAGLENLFTGTTSGSGTTTTKTGYGNQLSALVTELTGEKGTLKVAQDGITDTIKELDKQYDIAQARVDATMERYRAQFTQLDVMMNSMNNTLTYLQQQFEAMNKSTS